MFAQIKTLFCCPKFKPWLENQVSIFNSRKWPYILMFRCKYVFFLKLILHAYVLGVWMFNCVVRRHDSSFLEYVGAFVCYEGVYESV